MKILVGLGNVGDKYVGTRHNIGRDFLFWFAATNSFPEFRRDNFLKALVSISHVNGVQYALVLPETYMNLSGVTVKGIFSKWSDVTKEDVTIIHDDIDINLGEVKVSTDKGHGGHNGIRSILDEVKEKLRRIRIGICPKTLLGTYKKPHKDEVANFVLKKFGMFEKGDIEKVYKQVEGLV